MTKLLLLALAPLLCAPLQAGDGLSVDTPDGWIRREDGKTKQVFLVPPGIPAGKECVILVYPPQDCEGTAQTFLELTVQNATRGNQLQGAVQYMDLGSFRVAVLVQTTPQRLTHCAAVHVARWGTKAQMVLYFSTDLELFKKHAPSVQALLQKVTVPGAAPAAAATPAGTAVAGLVMPFPKGWTRQDDPAGWIVMTPPQELAFGSPRLFIATRKLEGSHGDTHRALMKSLVAEAKWEGSYISAATPTAGPFTASEANCSTDARAIRLYTVASGPDTMEAIVLSPVGRGELTAALMEILKRTTLKNPPPPAKRPAVVEAYRRPSMKKYMNLDGTFFYGSLKYERIILLSNGVVDFSMCHAEGLGENRDLLRVDAGTLDGFFGAWKAEGKTVRIRREAGKPEQVWERENGALRFGDQVWAAMPRVDGLRLKGRYSYKSDPKNKDLQFNYWVEFTEDGSFKTGGLLSWLAVGDLTGRPKPPETASGTYEIRDWTIWFKVNGAVVWSTDFMTLKEDIKDLETILIYTYGFKRE